MQKIYPVAAVFVFALLHTFAYGAYTYTPSPLSNGQASYWENNQLHHSVSTGLFNSVSSRGSVAVWHVGPKKFMWYVKADDGGGASIDVEASAAWQDSSNPPEVKTAPPIGSGDVRPPHAGFAKISVAVANGATAAGAYLYKKPGEEYEGKTKEKHSPPDRCEYCDENIDEDSKASESEPVTGSYLYSSPIDEDFGVQNSLYFGPQPTGLGAEVQLGYRPTRYFFTSKANLPITSFGTPDGIPGDTSAVVIYDGTNLIPYTPGTTHIFSTPVMSFALRGLDASAMPIETAPAPFIYSLQFASPGVAIIAQGAGKTPAIPGDFNRDTVVDAADYVAWRNDPTAYVDGSYDVWRQNFGNSVAGNGSFNAGMSVPEPATALLICLALSWIVARKNLSRECRRR